MPIFNVKCLYCDYEGEMLINPKLVDEDNMILEIKCFQCGEAHLKKAFSMSGKNTFSISGYSAKNGYSK